MYNYRDEKSPIGHQYFNLKSQCNGRVKILDNDQSIYWEGIIKPMPFSREYTVAIKYKLGSNPICVVKNPNLESLARGRKIPHIYSNDSEISGTVLCLYLPFINGKNNIPEWLPTDLISLTIIPWASLWLNYFEDWLYSDDWQGGGTHPEG